MDLPVPIAVGVPDRSRQRERRAVSAGKTAIAQAAAPRPLSRTRSQDARAGRRRLARWLNTNMVFARDDTGGDEDLAELLRHIDIVPPGRDVGGAFAALFAPGAAAARAAFRRGECGAQSPAREDSMARVLTVRGVLCAAWRRIERGARTRLLKEARRVAADVGAASPRAWIDDCEEAALRVLDGSLVAHLRGRDAAEPAALKTPALPWASSPEARDFLPRAVRAVESADAEGGFAVEFELSSVHARSTLQAVAAFYGVRAEVVAEDKAPLCDTLNAHAAHSRRARRAAILDSLVAPPPARIVRLSLRVTPVDSIAHRDREAIRAVRRALADAWTANRTPADATQAADSLNAISETEPIVFLIAVHARTIAEEGLEGTGGQRRFTYGRTAQQRVAERAAREAAREE